MTRFIRFLLVFALLSPVAALAEGTLYYDAATGDVFFDVEGPGGRFNGFDFRSAAGLIQTDNYLRLGDPTILLHTTETYLTDAAGLGTDRPDGLYGVGPIYPANVSEADFIADVTTRWGADNAGTVDFEIEFGRPAGVPRNDPNLTQINSWADSVSLRYLAPTGELVLDTSGEDGGYIGYFAIQSSQHAFLIEEAIAPDIDIWKSDSNKLVGIGLLAPGVHNLGLVLESGLSASEFASVISSAEWRGQTGIGYSELDLSTGQGALALALVHIPEPASVWLLAWGLTLCLLGRRSKR